MYTKNVNTDEIKNSFTELCKKFNNVVNRWGRCAGSNRNITSRNRRTLIARGRIVGDVGSSAAGIGC
jgi:hypothetical protein